MGERVSLVGGGDVDSGMEWIRYKEGAGDGMLGREEVLNFVLYECRRESFIPYYPANYPVANFYS